MQHTTSARPGRRAPPLERETAWFLVKQRGRRRRCGITLAALRLLAAETAIGSPADPPKRILGRHKDWVRALALLELAERGDISDSPLVLREAQVRFQLACDASADLPDVLCV